MNDDLIKDLEALISDPDLLEGSVKNVMPGIVQADEDVVPGFHGTAGFRDYDLRAYKNMVTRAKNYFGGRTWPDGETAAKETFERMLPDLIAITMRSLAAGYVIGYKWMEFQDIDWDEFSWRSQEGEVQRQASVLGSAQKVVILAGNHNEMTLKRAVEILQFNKVIGDNCEHVWDLWALVVNSVRTAWYGAGLTLGKKIRDEEITQAMEEMLS